MRDNSSIPQTCPFINKVRDFLESIDWDDIKEGDLKKESNEILDLLETIRKHNENLRSWGNSEYSRADDAERQVSDMERKIEDLESDIKTHLSNISDLEERISELECEINDFERQI